MQAELGTNSGLLSRRTKETFTESLLYALTHSTCKTTLEGNTIISPAVRMGKLRLRDVKTFAQSWTAKWPSGGSNPDGQDLDGARALNHHKFSSGKGGKNVLSCSAKRSDSVRLRSLAGGREVADGGNGEGVKAPQEVPCVPFTGHFPSWTLGQVVSR